MIVVLLVLAVVFAGVEAWRSKSFGWAALALLCLALAWPPLVVLSHFVLSH